MRQLFIFLALACLSACDTLPTATVPISLPPTAEHFSPPDYYQDLWQKMEECSGKTRDMNEITFYMVPDSIFFPVPMDTGRVAGYYDGVSHIVIADYWLDIIPVVQHEMLHAILQQPGHPPIFKECGVCSGTEECND